MPKHILTGFFLGHDENTFEFQRILFVCVRVFFPEFSGLLFVQSIFFLQKDHHAWNMMSPTLVPANQAGS